MSRTAMIRALAIGTAMLLPAVLSAQGNGVSRASPRSAAEQLEALAAAPKLETGDWVAAAQALRRAARLRASTDPRAVTDLLGAATAYRIAGRLVPARNTAVEGARRALRLGDVYTAANAYLDAARLSLELRDQAGAVSYLEQANRLAQSPRMTPEQALLVRALAGIS